MYIITGVSKGLGCALAKELLRKGELVIGIGRQNSITHENFTFFPCDLGDLSAIENLKIALTQGPITLINNAGIIGRVKRITDQVQSDLNEVLTVNVIAPMLLAKKVYGTVENKSNFSLVNISSGAAHRAIPSWASYCASKAALNMLSETFYLEEKEKGNDIKVYSIAPGVVDTDMQLQIRSTAKEDFSAVDNFIGLKEREELYSPKEAAVRILQILSSEYKGVQYDIRSV